MVKLNMYIGVMVMSLLLTTSVHADAESATTISLGQGLHFTSPEGKAVELKPGIYEVKQGGNESAPYIILSGRKGNTSIQAEPIEHEGELATPVALTVPANEDERQVVLLLPNGSGLEAMGSVSGVQTRGGRNRFGVGKALRTIRPARRPVRKGQGSTSSSGQVSTGPFNPVTAPSPELKQLQQGYSPLGGFKRRSLQELLNTYRRLPGGKDRIKRARQRGARISFLPPETNENVFSWFNPFGAASAWAQEHFSIALTPDQPIVGENYLSFKKVNIRQYGSISLFSDYGNPPKPVSAAFFWIQIPTTGWYIVNVEAATAGWAVMASLRHYEENKSKFSQAFTSQVQDWSYPQTQQGPIVSFKTRSYPALVELKAGFHEFHFTVTKGAVNFIGLSVESL